MTGGTGDFRRGSLENLSGYGRRDPNGEMGIVAGPGVVRAHPGIALACLAAGGTMLAIMVFAMLDPRRTTTGFPIAGLFYGVPGVLTLAQGLYLLLVPIVLIAEDSFSVRMSPFRRRRDYDPSRIAWGPGLPYVGRYLLLRGEGDPRKRRVLGLWLLSHGTAPRLFVWLDAKATQPQGPSTR